MTIQTATSQPTGIAATIQSIAGLLRPGGALTRGDVATLRRMDPRRPDAAFFKIEGLLLGEHLPGEADARADLETRWAAIVVGLAHMDELHRLDQRLGYALVTARFSELRFARLLRADVERLIDDLPMLARFLTAKGVPADWTPAAQLVLSAGCADEERIRRHLARDYYGALAREKQG
jgi:CRISPR system Cascade subunit CasB